MTTPDNTAGIGNARAMIARLTGPGPTPEQRAASRKRERVERAQLLDTAIPCTPNPETGRCSDHACPSCWLDAAPATDMTALPELSRTAQQAAHDAWRAAWLPYLCRLVTQALHAERALADVADAEQLGPQERELIADDPRATISTLSAALVPHTEYRPLLHVTGVLGDMVRQAEAALLGLAEGRAGALRMCSFLYVQLLAVCEDMLGDDVIAPRQLPALADFETDHPAVTGLRDVTMREPSPEPENGE